MLLVSGLVLYGGIKFRHKRGETGEPRQVSGSLKMEIAWTVAPAIVLVAIFVPTIMVMNKADPGVPVGQSPALHIIGHQFWWEYQLPKETMTLANGQQVPVTLANELHIPVGKTLYTILDSADVIHDFWVPAISRKIDIIKGQTNHLMLGSDTVGVYKGNCAEFCGAEHAWMLISVHVDSQPDYDAWLQQQKTVPAAPTAPNLAHGQQVFLNNTCANCHAIAGTSAQADVGPNLTHLGGRQTLGTGILNNSVADVKNWIQNVQTIKPGVKMPSYSSLNGQDLQDLADYLESLK